MSVQRYWEALEIINHTLRLEYNTISTEKKEEFRSLGARKKLLFHLYICLNSLLDTAFSVVTNCYVLVKEIMLKKLLCI